MAASQPMTSVFSIFSILILLLQIIIKNLALMAVRAFDNRVTDIIGLAPPMENTVRVSESLLAQILYSHDNTRTHQTLSFNFLLSKFTLFRIRTHAVPIGAPVIRHSPLSSFVAVAVIRTAITATFTRSLRRFHFYSPIKYVY